MIHLVLSNAVGKNCPNLAHDVGMVARALISNGKLARNYVSTGACDEVLMKGIFDTQRHWMATPDSVITVGGGTHKFIQAWKEKTIAAGVQLPGRLAEAWSLVSPLLPVGSYCSSGFRSAEAQRKILHDFFRNTFKHQIVAKYTQRAYDAVNADLLKNEAKVLEMVRGVGQAIAAPGKSAHQLGKAVDIGGPSAIDHRQAEIVALVARAHFTLFSGKVLMERNGCVHFEIR